jgi:hypothetical protein
LCKKCVYVSVTYGIVMAPDVLLLFCHVSAVLFGLSLLYEIPRLHSQTHHTPLASSGGVISPSQRPLPDNTQHSQEKISMLTSGFEPSIPACERPQTHASDRAATGIDMYATVSSSYCYAEHLKYQLN